MKHEESYLIHQSVSPVNRLIFSLEYLGVGRENESCTNEIKSGKELDF